jgi:NAD(P)-dependent dehydrogenase (short-subunit alcohol dehydrogenase family)
MYLLYPTILVVTKLNSETEPLASYNKPKGYFAMTQYSVSKLLLMYAETALAELARSKETGKPDFYVTVVCPGATASEIGRDATAWYYKVFIFIFKLLFQRKTEEGARTYISGVTQGEKAHGRFWKDDQIRE